MSGAKGEVDTVYSVTVRRENGDQRLLSLCRTEEEFRDFTVLELKSRVERAFDGVADIYHRLDPIRSICLVFADKRLKDEHTLSFYGIKHQDTIHVKWVILAVAEGPAEVHVLEGGGWNNKDKGKRSSMENLLNL